MTPSEVFGLLCSFLVITNSCTAINMYNSGQERHKERLIKAELAEYRVDPKTGQTSFVIFAEEKKEQAKQ